MKSRIIKVCFFSMFMAALFLDASAQRTSRKKTNDANQANQQQNQQTNVARPPSSYNPYGNIPIEKDTSGAGYNDSVLRKSFRPTDAFDKSFVSDRTPLPYEHLRWDDALYSEKVWRELDLREKLNQPFRYEAIDDNGSQMFINFLLKALKDSQITAFTDDRFTTPMSLQEIMQLTQGESDT